MERTHRCAKPRSSQCRRAVQGNNNWLRFEINGRVKMASEPISERASSGDPFASQDSSGEIEVRSPEVKREATCHPSRQGGTVRSR
jgi:hypothetical protein